MPSTVIENGPPGQTIPSIMVVGGSPGVDSLREFFLRIVLLVSIKVKTSAYQADRFIIHDMVLRKPDRRTYGLTIWKPHGF
jgi:hypothetical protein